MTFWYFFVILLSVIAGFTVLIIYLTVNSPGFCVGGTCSCDPGYVIIDNICEETCDSNPCKELIEDGYTGQIGPKRSIIR